ncbi:hypothetical protein JJJ17_05740 [Paracoccus caeni]|uniref:Component of SufBCD complex n=1 Tax=Paracoccus caeni TaxID=657651 RepID=A0A934SDM5_9RHOB|nr:hypothetical protein [Paracoccus caeni]MBK4215424.1 hypothetical protein [Paracoccus caeni]
MPLLNSLLGFLDSRSFGTVWFWLVLLGMWSVAGRGVLGVPMDVINRARAALRQQEPDSGEALHLMDWLSLTLPRWRLGLREGAVFTALVAFGLSTLGILGFAYGLEMAQALTVLLLPFLILFWMRIRLARRLTPLLTEAETGQRPLDQIAAEAVNQMIWHRRFQTLLSMGAVIAAAISGTIWVLNHPFGF